MKAREFIVEQMRGMTEPVTVADLIALGFKAEPPYSRGQISGGMSKLVKESAVEPVAGYARVVPDGVKWKHTTHRFNGQMARAYRLVNP